eukprot:358866-Chlamydomonas_euryale.AAC.7
MLDLKNNQIAFQRHASYDSPVLIPDTIACMRGHAPPHVSHSAVVPTRGLTSLLTFPAAARVRAKKTWRLVQGPTWTLVGPGLPNPGNLSQGWAGCPTSAHRCWAG